MSHCPSLIHALRQRGLRITPQREMIIEALAQAGDHVTTDEVFRAVKERSNAVNLATIYRTLDLLVAEGLICRTNMLNGQTVYVTHQHGAHIHLVCRNCGSIIAIDKDLAQPFIEQLQQEHDFVAEMQHISIVGLCSPCQVNHERSQSLQEEKEYAA